MVVVHAVSRPFWPHLSVLGTRSAALAFVHRMNGRGWYVSSLSSRRPNMSIVCSDFEETRIGLSDPAPLALSTEIGARPAGGESGCQRNQAESTRDHRPVQSTPGTAPRSVAALGYRSPPRAPSATCCTASPTAR